ncbi:MAG: hypothetical protein HQL40_15165, partial [Alphaproteobacteria bacterium]|nr:hypothetical protein [Alphaproteobacteria bacterium]
MDAVLVPPLPTDVTVNPIRDGAAWRAMREACLTDPGAFHGDIAARTIHWFDGGAWLSRDDDGVWRGFDAA